MNVACYSTGELVGTLEMVLTLACSACVARDGTVFSLHPVLWYPLNKIENPALVSRRLSFHIVQCVTRSFFIPSLWAS